MNVRRALWQALDRGWLPDAWVRAGIRALLSRALRRLRRGGSEVVAARHERLLAECLASETAPGADAAKRQHYELPTAFFRIALGPHLKYSCALWPEGTASLEEAERAMLELTLRRAQVGDGQRVLDLGCGWGSFCLYAAERFPGSSFTAVSHSRTQKEWIDAEARRRGLSNLETVTADAADYAPERRYDRIVSVEMLEHVRNHARLLERMAGWLADDGKLFIHVFAHRELAYLYDETDPDDWIAKHFFTGGIMPSAAWWDRHQDHFRVEERWVVSGVHYARTCRAWLERTDRSRGLSLEALRPAYGRDAAIWLRRWRVFFMACEELFAYGGGDEWLVSHARLAKRP